MSLLDVWRGIGYSCCRSQKRTGPTLAPAQMYWAGQFAAGFDVDSYLIFDEKALTAYLTHKLPDRDMLRMILIHAKCLSVLEF